MINYPVEVLLILIEAMKDKDINGKFINWLIQNWPELGAFVNSIKGDEKALKWLGNNNFIELVAIHDALFEEENKAFKWLKDNSYYSALLISSIKDDKQASEWLHNNCKILYLLAESIQNYKEEFEKEEKSIAKFFSKLHNPFS